MKRLFDYLKDEPFVPREWESRPVYSRPGDCLTCYFDPAESYRDRIDAILTVYRAFEDDRVVGFQIKGVKAVIKALGDFGFEFKDGPFKLSFLIMASNMVREGSDQPQEATDVWTFARRGGGKWELSAIQQT